MTSKKEMLVELLDELEGMATKSLEPQEIQEWIGKARLFMEHGTRGHYVQGCRHELCKAAEAEYQRNRKVRREKFILSILEDAP